ncbi:hypothetical protein SOV_26610 [Sporomusa ovata DSM 2662]|uniref:class I SAM-dependent methyltransferase n=1 Tax=Sporomusa ovata TaxID=2378 RepID=UPI0003883D85|nr:methylase involved in ubiquinone/menaquinone biosynthesis [Sporomusa ovata DSM 2662]
MNPSQIWSTYVQKAETLYRTRSVRFRYDNKDNFINMMGFKDGMSILEVGCGPGLLCHRLAEWLPNSKITGLDRDENFIYMPRIKLVHLV